MDNWIDLTKVPKKNGIGVNKDKLIYDWGNGIGCVCKFTYNDIIGEFEIVNYDKENKSICVLYLNDTVTIKTDSIIKCQLGKIVNGISKGDFKFNIGDIIESNNGSIFTILDREKRFIEKQGTRKFYYCQCSKCTGLFWRREYGLNIKQPECPICENKYVVEGINDIATTDPWMIPYFQGGIDIARKYSRGSGKREYFICPFCNTPKNKPLQIGQIYEQHGVSCPVCSDGMSYPNKFMYSFFKQLNVRFEIEKVFDWSTCLYDDYIVFDDKKIICENHGIQHYEETYFSKINRKRSLAEEQENDNIKRTLALSHDIDIYIELDCRQSNKEWIKKSIEKSALNSLFDISKVDFEKCDAFATSNLIKSVCQYKNENPLLYSVDIAKEFGVSPATISHYLNKGNELGWCEYDASHESCRKNSFLSPQRCSKPMLCNETGQVFFNRKLLQDLSVDVLGQYINGRNAQSVATGSRKQTKGYTFQYISKSEFNRIKRETPELAFGDFFISEEEVG